MKLGFWQGPALEGAREGGMAGAGKVSLEDEPGPIGALRPWKPPLSCM